MLEVSQTGTETQFEERQTHGKERLFQSTYSRVQTISQDRSYCKLLVSLAFTSAPTPTTTGTNSEGSTTRGVPIFSCGTPFVYLQASQSHAARPHAPDSPLPEPSLFPATTATVRANTATALQCKTLKHESTPGVGAHGEFPPQAPNAPYADTLGCFSCNIRKAECYYSPDRQPRGAPVPTQKAPFRAFHLCS